MKSTKQDVVVIGGGPAGSFSAFELAKKAVQVSVFEEHKEIGLPNHCAGHLSIRSLKRLDLYPLPNGIVENEFSDVNFYSPNGTKLSVHLKKPVTCVVNRILFDQYIAKKAQHAGATYNLNSYVTSLRFKNKFVNGINFIKKISGTRSVTAPVVIDAEGVSSRLLRMAGLTPFKQRDFVYTIEAEVFNVKNIEEKTVEVYLGSRYAPGFYAWLIPKSDGTAKLGLASKHGNPKRYLDRLITNHPIASKKLEDTQFNSLNYHTLPLGGPLTTYCSDGFLAVGDAASQTKPTTGGGVIFSILCAKIAAEITCKALKSYDFSANFLYKYQNQVTKLLSFDIKVMLQLRKFLNALTDKQMDKALGFAHRTGFADIFTDIDEIDLQGRMLMELLKKPAAYATLVYLIRLYLSTCAYKF